MAFFTNKSYLLLALFVGASFFIWKNFSNSYKIDFNSQVKPIINKKCISCHGGVKQNGGFSLLFREEALAKTESGKQAIIPGNAKDSELIKRITHSDPEERMPYKHDALTKDEIAILTKWIDQGAEWGRHWAYTTVEKQTIPNNKNEWVRNDIDHFILEKLKEENLSPSSEADKATLLRRVSLDITGLPPSEEIAKKYLNSKDPKAYEILIDDLLKSQAYGERWTALWMDVARYADTKGYEADLGRNIWKYRDWLIHAFNEDKPYDEFLIEQLAGDLLPNPDDAKYIATAFHRNAMCNDEGGTDNEEFRVAAVLDRVNTTWTGLMGTTFNCVQCHAHPYDPFKHDEYYKFMAFFNNSRDEDTEEEYPLLRHYKGEDSLKFVAFSNWVNANASPQNAKEKIHFLKTFQPSVNPLHFDQYKDAVLVGSHPEIRNYGHARMPKVNLDNKTEFLYRYVTIHDKGNLILYLDSLKTKPYKIVPAPTTPNGWGYINVPLDPVSGIHDVYIEYSNKNIKANHPNGIVISLISFHQTLEGKGKKGYNEAVKNMADLFRSNCESTPIMLENNLETKRKSHVFERGNWTAKGKEVLPDVPHMLNPFPSNAPKDRLGLAMWLVDKKNPLVSRTLVNRLWEQLYGQGIAETLEDLGTQGMPPTHKSLLDHLSYKLMHDHKWSVKNLLKEMVMSATYRQSSIVNDALYKKDPMNKLYARGPRIRLSAEQLRDQALAVSGLLSSKMYGPSVMPFQPDGIWKSPYNGDKWLLSKGEDQNRRALYTYWKRSSPYPALEAFDGTGRQVCLPRRIKTNTPIQALTSLNDSTSIVMARSFANKILATNNKDVSSKINDGYKSMFFKNISEKRLQALTNLYTTSKEKYTKNSMASKEVISDTLQDGNPEKAAMIIVANAMLNMDEWLNKN